MQDGIYTPFGLRALPEEQEERSNSVFHPRSVGALLSLAGMMLWMAFSGFFRRR